jgi:dTDP-4-dehydrorhamnose reductase
VARILVTGAGGFLGRTLIEELGAEHALFAGWRSTVPEAAGATLLEIDVTDPERVSRAMAAARPDLVVHGAAMSQPDDCERNPAAARAVIVDGTRHVAAAARAAGARLVHLSTDLVF